MPLGLTWVFGFLLLLPSLTISLSLQLPTVKKETSFLYVAFSSCFFTRWRLKGRELKINTPERRAEERGSEPESEPLSFFFSSCCCWSCSSVRMKMAPIPCFFLVCVCEFFLSAWRTAFFPSQPPALFFKLAPKKDIRPRAIHLEAAVQREEKKKKVNKKS